MKTYSPRYESHSNESRVYFNYISSDYLGTDAITSTDDRGKGYSTSILFFSLLH